MSIEISKEDALAVLKWAYENRECCRVNTIDENMLNDVSNIIFGTHKTYRYILITQLLAKSVNPEAETLALQAGAPFPGAFDSRSLCHNIIVPFERKYLACGLGGSNEPYLNKPARFTHLSPENAVRGGRDKYTLLTLVKILNSIDQSDAKKLLCFSISKILERAAQQNDRLAISKNFSTSLELYHFMCTFLSKSCEGETCVLLVGTMEKMFYYSSRDFKVVCHPTNEAGSSSREIGDIDVFNNGVYYYSIEVKDKNFTEGDVDFALNKMFSANAISGGFVYGPRAKFDSEPVFQCIQRYDKSRFIVVFENIFAYLKHMLMVTPRLDFEVFINLLNITINEINAKDTTREWLSEILGNGE